MKYRADIDGLRAVAVLSVLAFHYGAPLPEAWRLSGGFTGVDVFFVISGFLITSQLTDNIRTGTFSILNFYDRRVRRILPAALAMLAVTLIAGHFLLMPGDYMGLAASTATAAFGVSNFYFLANTGYFDQAANLLPLLHTWSLAVEEQFYVAWPLLLFVIAKAGNRINVAAIVSAITIVGLGASLIWFDVDPKAAFFMAVPRAWELSIGALLVFLPPLSRRLGELAIVGGLGLICLGFVVVRETAFPGAAALYPCIGAALVIWPRTSETVAGRTLGWLSPIGLISYSLYLWHWPVWVLFRVYINNGTPRIREALALAMISVILATVSYFLIEKPFRRRTTQRWAAPKIIGAAIASCLVIFCASMYIHSADGQPNRLPPEAYAMRSLDAMWDWPCKVSAPIAGMRAFCVFGANWETAKARAVLWGDSHSEVLASLIESAAKKAGVAVFLYRACPIFIDGVHIKREMATIPNYDKRCGKSRDEMMQILRDHPEIGIVILANSWRTATWNLYEKNNFISAIDVSAIKHVERVSSNLELELMKKGLVRALTELRQIGKSIKVVGSMPGTDGDPIPCAIASTLLRRGCPPHANALSLDQYNRLESPVNDVLASVSDAILPSEALCTEQYCITRLNGEFLYRDQNHIRRNLTQQTRDELARLTGIDRIFDPANAKKERESTFH